MTRSIPAHKQTNPSKQPGQIVFSPVVPNTGFDRMPFLKHSTAEPGLALDSGEFIPAKELTLNDYIAKKQDEPKRITFDEWWNEVVYTGQKRKYEYGSMSTDSAKLIWNSALKQGKL